MASDVTCEALAADLRAVAPAINEETVSNYIGLLRRLVVTGTGPILVTEDGTITAPLRALAP